MSASLCWGPPPSQGGRLSNELKFKLGKKLCDTDGSTGYPVNVNKDLIPYLEGLVDAGVQDADKLISLIKKHGEIELTWQH